MLDCLIGRFRGTVIDAARVKDRLELGGDGAGPRKFKGYTEEGIAFNKGHLPPVY